MANEDKKSYLYIEDYTAITTSVVPADTLERFYNNVPGINTNEVVRVVGNGTLTVAELVSAAVGRNPRSFLYGRVDSEELECSDVSTIGWYTIAEVNTGISPSAAWFTISNTGTEREGLWGCKVGFICSNVSRENAVTIEWTNRATVAASFSSGTDAVASFRLAKSDSVPTAGAKLQAYLNPKPGSSLTNIVTAMHSARSVQGTSSWRLVAPYLDNTPTLPDGVTSATFREAGAVYSIPENASFVNLDGFVSSADTLVLTLQWPEIANPKAATLTITDPSTSWIVSTGSGAGLSVTGFTVSSLSLSGKHVNVFLSKTGAFTGYVGEVISMRTNGTGAKFVLS